MDKKNDVKCILIIDKENDVKCIDNNLFKKTRTVNSCWCRCELPAVSRRHVVIARLTRPANLGVTCQDVQLVVLVVAPTKEVTPKQFPFIVLS